MTTPSQSNRNHQHEATLAYDLFGYLKITNIFTRSEISEISDAYDQYHLDINKIEMPNGEKRIPPTGSLLENDPKLIDSILSKSELIHTLREVAGKDVQFAGSDSVHIYNDSVGIHRDTLYQYDFPKILLFLSDSPAHSRFNDAVEQKHGGNFMVLPGSHIINDTYTTRSSRLCHWPYKHSEQFSRITPSFTFGNSKQNGSETEGKQLIQCIQNKDKYHAFSKIQFKKGNVVLFSTRAMHALYPLFQDESQLKHANSPLKLLGILFIEGYSKQNGITIEEALKIQEPSEELIKYISTVYNLRLYNTTTDHGQDARKTIAKVSGLAMGLNRTIDQLRNPKSKRAVQRLNLIHDFYSRYPALIDTAAGRSKQEIDNHFLKINNQYQKLLIEEQHYKPNPLSQTDPAIVIEEGTTNNKKEWAGLAKYLPMINNERMYLFYKWADKLFSSRKD